MRAVDAIRIVLRMGAVPWVKSGRSPHHTKKGPGRRHAQGRKEPK